MDGHIKMFAHLACTSLAIRKDGAIVSVHHTHHQVRGTNIVDVLLLDLVVEHGVEEEILWRLGVICLGVPHTDLSSLGIGCSSTVVCRIHKQITFDQNNDEGLQNESYTRLPFLISSPKRGRILTTTFTVSSGLLIAFLGVSCLALEK